MRVSYVVPVTGTKVTVVRDVLAELGLRNGCLLYALPLVDNPTIILSPIPPQIWNRAAKLTIYLSQELGSISKAAKIASNLGINLFASWASPTTDKGDGIWTSVVEVPIETSDEKEINSFTTQIEKNLENEGGILCNLDELQNLQLVRLVPLKVLSNIREHININYTNSYQSCVENNLIDLNEFKNNNKECLYNFIRERWFRGEPPPRYAIITPDTEERYSRLTFLPQKARMLEISLKIKIESEQEIFKGYFGAVLDSLQFQKLNIFTADNFMLKKIDHINNEVAKKKSSETAHFSFIVDASKAYLPIDGEKLKKDLFQKVSNDLLEHAKKESTDEKISNVAILKNSFQVKALDSLFAKCFLATNARKNDPCFFACRLIAMLRSLKLEPINVESTLNKRIREDVEMLLPSCPIVVSLHLPMDENKLGKDKKREIGKSHEYCPSDWVLFEESYALALGAKVFRMRHEKVRKPKFSSDEFEYIFSDESSFAEKLEKIGYDIRRYQATKNYLDILKRCEEKIISFDDHTLFERELDAAYGCVNYPEKND